jgi:NAD binding domain of 6-phosphogluconate dehydrogenase
MSRTAREPKSASLPDRASSSISRDNSVRDPQSTRAPIEGRIGVVGLGKMGTAMAANLVVAGREVIGYVRRPEQASKLIALGLDATSDVAALSDCEIVISMLPDDAALREVVYGRERIGTGGLADRLMPGAIHLSMSTISPAAASELARAHAQRGQRYVAAPVLQIRAPLRRENSSSSRPGQLPTSNAANRSSTCSASARLWWGTISGAARSNDR